MSSWVFRPILDFCHTFLEKLLCDAQGIAEVHGVQSACLLIHDHHDVVGWLVVDQ